MTLPVRSYRGGPAISVVDPAPESNSQMEATVRRRVPPFLLQLTRDSGVDVDVPAAPFVERDESAHSRPTVPAPFWVARISEASGLLPIRSPNPVMEPEPRQTTPSIVKLATPRPRRWLATVSAVALILGAAGIAGVFAQAEIAIEAR